MIANKLKSILRNVNHLKEIISFFIRRNKVPLKWKILFVQSVFWTRPYFCNRFYQLLQAYNQGDHYDFDGLKVTFLPLMKRTVCRYFVEPFLVVLFPALYGGDIYHPLSHFESNYVDDNDISIKPNDIVFDCGAHIGFFTIGASKKAYKGKVFAFEPFPDNAKLLLKNVNQNNLKNVTLIQKAVCDVEKRLIIHFDAATPSSSGIYNKPIVEDPRIIQGTTIDQVYRDYNLESVDFIKMDIEGMERDALKGAAEVISKFKPRLSICTYHLPDDLVVLPEIITGIRSDYKMKIKARKLYAY